MISSLIYNPALVRFLSVMDGDNTISLVVRDSIENPRRIHYAAQQNEQYGKEMFRTMWGTSAIWGLGMPAMRKVYDAVAHGAFKKPFTDLDSSVLTAGAAQTGRALSEKLYSKQLPYLQQWIEAGQKSGGAMAQKAKSITGVLGHALQDVSKLAAVKNSYEGSFGLRVALCAGLPALSIGMGLTELNHYLTRKENAAKLAHPENKTLQVNNFADSDPNNAILPPISPLLASHQNAALHGAAWQPVVLPKALQGTALAQNNDATLQNWTQRAKTGNLASANNPFTEVSPSNSLNEPSSSENAGLTGAGLPAPMLKAFKWIHGNDKMANLIGIDGGISIPRILDVRHVSEMANWVIQEGLLVYMMYFGAPLLNEQFKKGSGLLVPGFKENFDVKHFAGASELIHMPFEVFRGLHNKYIQPNKLEHFAGDFAKAMQALGLSPMQDSDALAKKLTEESTVGTLKHKLEQLLLPGNYKPGSNLIVELAADAGLVPVWREGKFGGGNIKALNPMQTIKFADALESVALEHPNVLKKTQTALGSLINHESPTVKDGFNNLQSLILRLNKLHNVALQTELTHMVQGVAKPLSGTAALKTVLGNTMLAKTACLLASLGASYVVLAELMPRFQKFVVSNVFHEDPSLWTQHDGDKKAATTGSKINTKPATLEKTALQNASLDSQLKPTVLPVANPTMQPQSNPFQAGSSQTGSSQTASSPQAFTPPPAHLSNAAWVQGATGANAFQQVVTSPAWNQSMDHGFAGLPPNTSRMAAWQSSVGLKPQATV
jgi:hypothetical protein